MRTGAVPLFAGVLLVIVISAMVISSGILQGTRLVDVFRVPGALFDLTCQPGTILEPIRQTILCERSPESFTGVFIPSRTQYGTWPLVSERVWLQCPPASDAAREGCQVRITTGGNYQVGEYGSIQSAPATLNYNYGDVIDLRLLNSGMYVEVRYTTKQLSLYDLTGGVFQRKICDSCDTTCTGMPTEIYNNLPRGSQGFLNVGDSIETVVRWQEYPVAGNYIEWSDPQLGLVHAQCVRRSAAEAVIHKLDKYEGHLSCHYFRDTVLDIVECCPGDTFTDRLCNDNGVWETIPSGGPAGPCCVGGICSVSNCPGEGAWDWQNWDPGEPVERYQCYAPTGECILADMRYDVQCNPMTGEGCPLTQRCDPATWTCTSLPVTQMTCTEYGFECCIEGLIPPNVEPQTCAEAGFPANYECVNGFCQDPLPVNVCNYDGTCTENEVADCPDCQSCDFWCRLQAFLWMWLVGIIVAIGLLIGLAVVLSFFGIPFGKFLTVSPFLTILLVVILGFALAWLFSVPVASLAATLL